jgi:hypothetical protein
MMTHSAVPLWLKIIHTAFVAVLIPAYWIHYGPENFLWFSDIALIFVTLAMWMENRLLPSMAALGVLALELAWNIDFFAWLITDRHIAGMSAYMHDPQIPLLVRGLSLFHVWLPWLIIWLVWKRRYDRKALLLQTALAWIVLPISYVVSDPQDNINWVFGAGAAPQNRIPPLLYLTMLMLALPIIVYLPTHLLLRRLFGARPR